MKEAKSYTSAYDMKRTSAMSGPHRRPSRSLARLFKSLLTGIILAALVFMVFAGVSHG